ncbi:MAG: hypothetical protein Q9227_002667 [Pyrenula ochraceoflavens]
MGAFTKLAAELSAAARALDADLEQTQQRSASIDVDDVDNLPAELEGSRAALIDVAQDIKRRALGPRGTLTELLLGFADEISLRAVYVYDIANRVPLSGSISFESIAAATGEIDGNVLKRLLRPAMANGIFAEAPPGHVRHTAASRMLATESGACDAVGLMTCELSPAAQLILDALKRWPKSEDPAETAWALRNGQGKSMFACLAAEPARAQRFGAGMRFFARGPGWDLDLLVKGYEWEDIDVGGKVMVDVGGGQGAVSRHLAAATTRLKFIVQDLPGTAADGKAALPDQLKERVEFMPHDFLKQQPVEGADVYFFRWIMHNWSDGHCIRILRALVAALKPGARVLIYEWVLSEEQEALWLRKQPELVACTFAGIVDTDLSQEP